MSNPALILSHCVSPAEDAFLTEGSRKNRVDCSRTSGTVIEPSHHNELVVAVWEARRAESSGDDLQV